MSTLDKFLAFGSSFDCITPLIDLGKDLSNRTAQDIDVSRYNMSVGQAKRKLKPYGIKPWGVAYTEHFFSFRVKECEVEQAKQILGVE